MDRSLPPPLTRPQQTAMRVIACRWALRHRQRYYVIRIDQGPIILTATPPVDRAHQLFTVDGSEAAPC